MIELTPEQRNAIAAWANPAFIDPDTKAVYVLVRKDIFEGLKTLLATDEYDPDEGLAHMNDVMAADDAADPLLESYQLYRGTNSMKRGDVVLVPFPFQDKLGEKIRPEVIVQNDAENARLANTVIAMITGNLRDASQATTISIDPATSDGAGSGLAGPSLIKCHNLATVRQKRVLKQIGHLSNPIMIRVNHALIACLDLP